MENLWLDIAPKAVCISTTECVDRRRKCAAEFGRVGLKHYTFVVNDKDPASGIRGCFMAHKNVVLDAYLNGYEKLLVFEDDILFDSVENVRKGLTNVKSLIKSNDDTWDIIYLGHAAMSPLYVSNLHEGIVSSNDLRYMHAIVWSRKGMAIFLNMEFKEGQLDVAVAKNTNAYAPYPMIAYQNDMDACGTYTIWYNMLIYLRGVVSATAMCKTLEKVFFYMGKISTLFK